MSILYQENLNVHSWMIFCPNGIIPDSSLIGLNNTHTHTYIYIYIYNIHTYIYIYIYMYVCMYVYTAWNNKIVILNVTHASYCVWIYIYIYIYSHTIGGMSYIMVVFIGIGLQILDEIDYISFHANIVRKGNEYISSAPLSP